MIYENTCERSLAQIPSSDPITLSNLLLLLFFNQYPCTGKVDTLDRLCQPQARMKDWISYDSLPFFFFLRKEKKNISKGSLTLICSDKRMKMKKWWGKMLSSGFAQMEDNLNWRLTISTILKERGNSKWFRLVACFFRCHAILARNRRFEACLFSFVIILISQFG